MVNETNDVVLTALVHVIGDKAQPVYRRKDALEERHRSNPPQASSFSVCRMSNARLASRVEQVF
jgi:hypothetical protein